MLNGQTVTFMVYVVTGMGIFSLIQIFRSGFPLWPGFWIGPYKKVGFFSWAKKDTPHAKMFSFSPKHLFDLGPGGTESQLN